MTTCGCCAFGNIFKKKPVARTESDHAEVGQRYENVEVVHTTDSKQNMGNETQLNYIQVEFSDKPVKPHKKLSVNTKSDSVGVTYSEVTVEKANVYANT